MKRRLLLAVLLIACVDSVAPDCPIVVGPGCTHEGRYYDQSNGKTYAVVRIWYAQCPDSTPPIYKAIPDTTRCGVQQCGGDR